MVQSFNCDLQTTYWFADSGSSHHMSYQRSSFAIFTHVPIDIWPVQAVDSHTIFIEGYGDITIEIFV